MSAPIRIGVIGSGFGARVVAPIFAATDGCEVVDVVSARDSAAVGGLCARTDVDLISVHSPPFLHVDHVERAIDARHAVLCDKPFGRNATEAAQLVARAADGHQELAGDAGQSQVSDAEDTVRAWLHSADGASIAIDSTFVPSASIAPRVVIIGSMATAEIPTFADGLAAARVLDAIRGAGGLD